MTAFTMVISPFRRITGYGKGPGRAARPPDLLCYGAAAPGRAQPAYLVSISIQLPTVKETEAQYSGSSSTSLPSVVHHS